MFRSKATSAGSGAPNTFTGHGRTFVSNSYNASDAINMVAWDRVYASDPLTAGFSAYDPTRPGCQLYAYTQGLIRLRRSTNAFRLADAAISANLAAIPAQGGSGTTLAFGYRAASTDGTGTYYVFHNADTASRSFTVGASLTGAVLLADQASAGVTAIPSATGVTLSPDGLTVTLAPLTSAIYKL
jgi:pullulanase/glycogen debranching enzyme